MTRKSAVTAFAAAVALLVLYALSRPPITAGEAEGFAKAHFERFCMRSGLDVSAFSGPVMTTESGQIPMGFEWVLPDTPVKTGVLIWVDDGGWTDLSLFGEVDRLQGGPKKEARRA